MNKVDILAACVNTAHYTLVLYGLFSRTLDNISLALFIYTTGLITLFLYALGKVVHKRQLAFANALLVGYTTWLSSNVLASIGPFGHVLKFAFSTAFNIGSTRHAIKRGEVLVDARDVLIKNILMNLLTLIINLAYTLV